MQGCDVRSAREADLEAILGLYHQLAGDRADAQPADAQAAEGVFRSIVADPDRYLLVAEAGGKTVGTADMMVIANLTHRGRPWAIVENVVVDQRWRSHGVGGALMGELVNLARERHCYKVQLLSLKHRGDAHRFYRSMGFESLAEGFRIYLDGDTRG